MNALLVLALVALVVVAVTAMLREPFPWWWLPWGRLHWGIWALLAVLFLLLMILY